jgi:hypothetical protein
MFHVPVQLGVQAMAKHQEVGIATAMFLTFTSLGGSVGSAIAGAIWTGVLPERLELYLPEMSNEERRRIYDDFKFAMSFPMGSIERNGIIEAYVDVMKKLTMTATLAALPMIIFVILMREVKLDKPRRRPSQGSAIVDDDEEDQEGGSTRRLWHPRQISRSSRPPKPSDRNRTWWTLGGWIPRHQPDNEENGQ